MLRETQMKITWINCADAMPPDDGNLVIVKDLDGLVCKEGYIVNAWKDRFDETAKWTPYTPEKWKELNYARN